MSRPASKAFLAALRKARRPLGPSNDDVPPEEIIAAELAQNPDVWAQWGDCSQLIDDDLTRLGVRGFLSLGALSPDAEHSAMSFQDELDRRDYWAGWLARDIAGLTEPDDAWSWDPWRPVAGQYEAHMACGDAMLDEVINRFAPSDTASRDPWHTTEETQSTGNSETIDALIERSSVGQGLRNIRENGIDAELKQLEEEMKLLPDAHGGADL